MVDWRYTASPFHVGLHEISTPGNTGNWAWPEPTRALDDAFYAVTGAAFLSGVVPSSDSDNQAVHFELVLALRYAGRCRRKEGHHLPYSFAVLLPPTFYETLR